MNVYSFFERKPPERVIDIMVKPLPQYDQIYRRRVTVHARGVAVPLAPVDVLVELKQAAGRTEDLRDIVDLKRLGKVP